MQTTKEIILKAKKDVFSNNFGNFLTSTKGDGIDFKEIKEYAYGDDIKKINWKASAKSGEVKVNVFNETKQLNVIVAFMLSGSMHFGSCRLKREVASEILAILSYSAIKNSDMLHPMIFSQENERFYKPGFDEGVVYQFVKESMEAKLLGKSANFDAFCKYINHSIKKRSMIFLIGDFYGDVDLSNIAYKNDLYALIVRDRLEESAKFYGEFDLVDPNTQDSGEFYMSKSVASEYEKLIKKQDTKLDEHFLKHHITHGKIYTDEDVYLKLSQVLKG